MTDTTPDFGLPELVQGQANPDVTFNTSLRLMQALQNGVIDRAVNTPAVGPAEQDAYIIGAAPTGVWTGHANCIAVYIGGEWKFVPGNDDSGTPITMGARQEGLSLWVNDENLRYIWSGAAWAVAGGMAASSISFAATDRLLGRDTAGAGTGEEITVGGGIEFTGSGGIQTSAFTGDVTKSAGGTALSIASNSLALAKLANAGAQYDIVGRKTASGGAWEDCTRTQLLLAGTDLANTFIGAQTVNAGSGLTPGAAGLTLRSDDGANIGPVQVFYHNSASPANADVIAIMGRAYFNNSLAAQTVGLQFLCSVDNVTSGAEAVHVTFSTVQAGVFGGRLVVGNGIYTIGAGDLGANTINASSVIKPGVFTVATLPAAAIGQGSRAHVTDAAAPAFGAAVAGGGAVSIPVFSTGAAWNVG